MNNERQTAQLEMYNYIGSQRRRSILAAEGAGRATHSEVENSNQTQEVTNNNQFNLGKLATKKAMIAQFIDATDF